MKGFSLTCFVPDLSDVVYRRHKGRCRCPPLPGTYSKEHDTENKNRVRGNNVTRFLTFKPWSQWSLLHGFTGHSNDHRTMVKEKKGETSEKDFVKEKEIRDKNEGNKRIEKGRNEYGKRRNERITQDDPVKTLKGPKMKDVRHKKR
jgi:hypothetical protein